MFYNEYADDAYTEAASGVIVQILWIRQWENHRGEFTLEKTELSGITLADAKARAEKLMEKLGIACNQFICDYDYSAIPASEEGYYLHYSPLGIDSHVAGSRYSAIFYVNLRGIVYANIRNQFNRGEIVYTPETLITPDAAIEKLTKEMGRSILGRDEEIKAIQQAALTYEAVRAENKADGMVFVPTWMILYQDTSAVRQGYSCYALINAVDGTLIDATFR